MLYNPIHDLTEVGQALHRAADIIDEKGHCQGNFTKNGKVCLVAALTLAGGTETAKESFMLESELSKECVKAVGDHLGIVHINAWITGSYLCMWNNQTGRTGDEVSAMLREAGSKHKKVA